MLHNEDARSAQEKEDRERFSYLMRAAEVVGVLLFGTHTEIAQVPLKGEGGFGDALNEVEHHIKAGWVRRARAKWLLMGIEIWENWVAKLEQSPDSLEAEYFSRNDPTYPAIYRISGKLQWMDLNTILMFLAEGKIGSASGELSDRFLAVLRRLLDLTEDKSIEKVMRQLIGRRTGTTRDGDPECDNLAQQLLLRHYGLE